MSSIVVQGHADIWGSQYGKSIRGRGRLMVSERGVRWEVPRLLGGRTDESSWKDIHTFGREGSSLHIAWTKWFEGTGTLMAAFTFKGASADILRAVELAHQYLPAANWKESYSDVNGTQLDEVWARDWGEPSR